MKNLYILTIFLLSLSFLALPQTNRSKFLKQRDKIHQLEKLKLIEVLDMDENTSIKFFARRNEMQNEIESLQDKEDDLFSKLEETLNSDEKNNEAIQKQLIHDLQNIKDKIESAKKHFINSLNDILSTEKIAKYIVFEKKFREEIRRIILDRRRPPND